MWLQLAGLLEFRKRTLGRLTVSLLVIIRTIGNATHISSWKSLQPCATT